MSFFHQSLSKFLIPLSFSCLSLTMMPPVFAQQEILKTITVTGRGVQRIPTTLATVQLGVEIEGKNATQIQEEVAKRTSSIIELLKSKNVQKLQTTGVQLRSNYNYNNNQREFISYTATNLVSFELSIDQVGAILDESVKRGVTRIDNVGLTATEEAINQAQKQALIKATQDAQQQAETVLNALNLQPQEIVTININGANIPQPLPKEMIADRFAMANTPTTPIVGGEQEISASVTLQIRY